MHKITIDLPETFVESSVEEQEGSLCDSQPLLGSAHVPAPSDNIRVYCRFRPSACRSALRHDESMVEEGENRFSFDGIFGEGASQE